MSSIHKPSRARRVLGVLGSVVGVTVTFVAGAAAAAVIHLDMPVTRRLVATQVNAMLPSILEGQVHINRIGHVGFDGVSGIAVTIKDGAGIQVLDISGVSAKANVLAIARSALFGKGPIVIPVDHVKVDNVDANLDTDNDGNLRIANAFDTRTLTPPDGSPSRGVKVDAPDIQLGHAWIHGYPPGGQPVDADAHNLVAAAHLDTNTRLDAELKTLGIEARALPRGVDPKGNVHGTFTMPMVGDKPPMALSANFDGTVGNVPTKVVASLNGSRLDATVDAHDATGNDSSLMVTEVTIKDALTLHAEAHGDLPHIDGKANVALGDATVNATASVDTGPTTRIKGNVAVRNVDVSKLQATAPKTSVGLDATGDVAIGDDGISGTATVDTLEGTVDKQRVPPVNMQGKFAGKSASVSARVKDLSMPTEIDVDVKPRTDRADGQIITAKVKSIVPDVGKLPEIGSKLGGGAMALDASAELKLPEKDITGKAKVAATNVRQQGLSLGIATLDANVKGNLDRPVIDAKVDAHNLVSGTLPIANMDAGTRIVIDVPTGAIRIENPHAEATRLGSQTITATAKSVIIAGANLKVDGAIITGVGDPIHADVDKTGNDIDGTVDAPRIDLKLAAKLAGMQENLGVETGTLKLVGTGNLHGREVNANFRAELRDFSSKNVKTANATVDAKLAGRDVTFGIDANVGDAGNLKVVTDHLTIGGPAVDPESWKRAHGKVSLDGVVDLQKANRYLPPKSLPVEDLNGYVVLQGHIIRPKDEPPSIVLHAHTKDLVVAGQAPAEEDIAGTKVQGVAPWRVTGMDVGVDVQNDALSGLTTLAFRVTDRHGMLVAFDSKTYLPYQDIINHPETAKSTAMHAPLSAMMIVPTRRLQDLPPIVGLKDTAGSIQAEMEVGGTVLDPRVRFIGKGRGLRAPSMPKGVRVDSDIALDYDGKQVKLAVKSKDKDKDLLTLSSTVDAVAADFIVGRADGKDPQWTGSAKAHLASFPLESVPAIAQQRVKGNVSGDVELDDLHKDARVKAHIALEGLKVGKVEYTKGSVDAEIGGGKMAAKLRIDQKDGFIDATATSGMTWGAELAPALAKDSPLEAKLEAKNFRAAALQPFVASVVPTLDGNIDANAHAKITPGVAGAELDGKVVFSNGTVQPAALGEELRNVKATITMAQDGTIKLTDVSAEGIQGQINASGNAKLDGMRLANAVVNIDIPRRKAFDFALQGQPMGTLYGKINVTASQNADATVTTVGVDVPNLNVELPSATKTGVETLDAKKNIRVGVYRGKSEFVKLPLDKHDTLPPAAVADAQASTLEVTVKLGRVEISKGNQARVALAGNLQVGVGFETKIKGEIHALEGGWADVQGKKFEVEKASVTFNGGVDINPVVLATASWTAADGTKVYADFVGPVKTGKVLLRSEPSRPQNEILAIILFGTADGANPSPQSGQQNSDGTTNAAVGAGGGLAAAGLTNALDDMTGLQITARIDSTDSNNPKPELEFQISPKVGVAFAHIIGTPPITEPDLNLASVEYRFHRNWSLETTVGDQGKVELDAIWQKRY